MSKHHVIIGGGPAATNAVETIRQMGDAGDRITLVSDEPAHSRMALPYWLCGNIPREHTHTGDEDYFNRLNVDARIGARATALDTQNNTVSLDNGDTLDYDNLLIATGSSPLDPPIPGTDLPGVQPMWSLAHTQLALDTADGMDQPRVALVGAGFIGFIVLNAMFKRGWKLSVVEREGQVLPRMLDAASASFVESWLGSQNVDVHTGTTVTEIQAADGGSKVVQLSDGSSIEADLVIIATGIRANVGLVDGSGIDVDQAILVNNRMQSSVPNVYAAGDVAQGPVLYSSQPEVHAIQPTAVDQGRVAGANMAGQDVTYPGSLLMNVVDVCGLQCASFGNWNDESAEAITISNPIENIYRKLLWTGDQITGAIFTGRPNDMGMLTDVGMVKGILQTQTPLGAWKGYLSENPFDIRRAYIAAGVAQKLTGATLLGRPTRPRGYRFGNAQPVARVNDAHALFADTRPK